MRRADQLAGRVGVEVADIGRMLHTPPITYFANALFQQQVPFGRGRIMLEGTDTALSINVYTTRGILVPGVISKGTEMKLVFRDDRIGEISDIFCVPTSELTPEQVGRRGLLDSELDWETAVFKLERMARSLARSKKS
jgi:hypothetical protein